MIEVEQTSQLDIFQLLKPSVRSRHLGYYSGSGKSCATEFIYFYSSTDHIHLKAMKEQIISFSSLEVMKIL